MNKKRKILVVLLLVGSTLLSSFAFYSYQVVYTANLQVDKEETFFYIPDGADFKYVQNALYDLKIVNDLVAFSFLAKMMDYHEAVKPGRYKIKKDMSNLEAIRMLRAGDQTPTTVSFSSAKKLTDLSEQITKNIQVTPGEFDQLILDSAVMASYGFKPETFISMFIPNTYEVYWTIKPKELLDRLYKEYNNFWTPERLQKAEQLSFSKEEVSTLASIVQAETSKNDEKPIVAGLYLNRLRRGIPLQADPTLIFALDDFTIKRVLRKDKQVESPYNTYKYAGLPPGPIRMPNIASLDAVLNYESHDYLYMCAKEDFSGYHNFAKTLRQHNINARKYQRALNQQKVFR